MSLTKIDKLEDGTIEISVVKKTKRVRVSGIIVDESNPLKPRGKIQHAKGAGTFRTITSYDGDRYVLDRKKEQRRIEARDKRKPGTAAAAQELLSIEAKEDHRQTRMANVPYVATAPRPLFTLTDIGEEKSRERSRHGRNLKNFINVKLMKPVHQHRCHNAQFFCCCDTPYFKRKCGGDFCLKEKLK